MTPVPPERQGFEFEEVGSVYAVEDERFVVSLILTFAEGEAQSPAHALKAALDLVDASGDTVWMVYDRGTGKSHFFEQEDADDAQLA